MAETTGLVVRALGGFYRVVPHRGEVVDCRLAGRLKSGRSEGGRRLVLPGDQVRIEKQQDTWLIQEVLPRKVELVRPPVANVDICVVVQSFAEPAPRPDLIDRILVLASDQGIKPIICWTKADLVPKKERHAVWRPYQNIGVELCVTSAVTGLGLHRLAALLDGHISILAGASGVGKSTLLNALCPGLNRETGEISKKTAHGRHTTRHTELVPLPKGGWVADSPGFTVLDLHHITPERLPLLYADFAVLTAGCRFRNCRHKGEPECAVISAVSRGDIAPDRYRRYLSILAEVESNAGRF